MKAADLGVLVRGVAPVVKAYVAAALDGYAGQLQQLAARLKALEERPPPDPVPGPAGPPGPMGEKGEPGPAITGPRGERGATGSDGLIGPVGPSGPQGEAGRDGRDGLSIAGPPGEKGIDGAPGAAGRDGTNGRDAVLGNLKVEHDGKRTVTICWKDGMPLENGVIRFPVPIYEGIYSPTKVYDQYDLVTFGGSVFAAQVEHPTTKPEDGSGMWKLIVKRGRDGTDGKPVK